MPGIFKVSHYNSEVCISHSSPQTSPPETQNTKALKLQTGLFLCDFNWKWLENLYQFRIYVIMFSLMWFGIENMG